MLDKELKRMIIELHKRRNRIQIVKNQKFMCDVNMKFHKMIEILKENQIYYK